jgi:hypothetical protein
LISNAHITEWELIVNTAITENQRFFTTEIDIAHMRNITHKIQLLSEVIKIRAPAYYEAAVGDNHYTMPHPNLNSEQKSDYISLKYFLF